MESPNKLSIEELIIFIDKYPRRSACNRQDVESFQALLARRIKERDDLLKEKESKI